MTAWFLTLSIRLEGWVHTLEYCESGCYLGQAPGLSPLEDHALVMARLAFAGQPWM